MVLLYTRNLLPYETVNSQWSLRFKINTNFNSGLYVNFIGVITYSQYMFAVSFC